MADNIVLMRAYCATQTDAAQTECIDKCQKPLEGGKPAPECKDTFLEDAEIESSEWDKIKTGNAASAPSASSPAAAASPAASASSQSGPATEPASAAETPVVQPPLPAAQIPVVNKFVVPGASKDDGTAVGLYAELNSQWPTFVDAQGEVERLIRRKKNSTFTAHDEKKVETVDKQLAALEAKIDEFERTYKKIPVSNRDKQIRMDLDLFQDELISLRKKAGHLREAFYVVQHVFDKRDRPLEPRFLTHRTAFSPYFVARAGVGGSLGSLEAQRNTSGASPVEFGDPSSAIPTSSVTLQGALYPLSFQLSKNQTLNIGITGGWQRVKTKPYEVQLGEQIIGRQMEALQMAFGGVSIYPSLWRDILYGRVELDYARTLGSPQYPAADEGRTGVSPGALGILVGLDAFFGPIGLGFSTRFQSLSQLGREVTIGGTKYLNNLSGVCVIPQLSLVASW